MPTTILTEISDKILTVTLNRPKKLNALTPTLLAELKTELDSAAANDNISVVIIKSAGRAFCVGYDLNEENWITSQYPANYPDGVEIEQDKKDIMALLDYWLDMWRFPKPIICQVQGACLSGAGEMLAVSDLVVASEAANFGHPAGRDLGIPPTVFFWPLTIGMRKTKEDIAKTPVNHLMILKQSTNNFYDNMNVEKSTRQASDLDAEFHQSPTFLAFFKLVREKGMKAALVERARLFG